MPGWVGNSSNKALALKKGWVGIDGKARELAAGWVGVNGVAKKIWPASYVRHYHVASGNPTSGNRESEELNSGYDTSGTTSELIRTTSGGCYTKPYYQWKAWSENAWLGRYHENCRCNPGSETIYTTEDAGEGKMVEHIVITCTLCGLTYEDTNTYQNGEKIAYSRGGHPCGSCAYAEDHYGPGYTFVEGVTAPDGAIEKTVKGYAPGCGYQHGQLIE